MKRIAILLCLPLAGCVAHPAGIAPAMFSPAPYRDVPCDDLREELSLATMQREADIETQMSAQAKTFSMSLVLGLPPVRLDASTGHEGDVARSKGIVSAIEYEIDRRCDGPVEGERTSKAG